MRQRHQGARAQQRLVRTGLTALGLALALSGCGLVGGDPVPVPGPIGGNPAPDARGVITYASYQVAVAREGDTLESLAGRLGITTVELASANALPAGYRLRAGEVVLLPDGVARPEPGTTGGFETASIGTQPLGWSPEQAAQAIDSAPASATSGPAATPPAVTPFGNGEREPLIDPVRHRVEPGETAYSIARLYDVSVTALASWNGLGPDLAVREDQELLIPIVSGANRISGSADTVPGEGTGIAAPPSAADPLPQDIVAGAAPASPELGQYRTPQGGRLRAPVDAPVTRPYNAGPGPERNEGVGFAVPAGTAVRAAGSGEVALVSQSIGGLGTIVLVRHTDDLMTVYGRVSDVRVTRGQRVAEGETIGAVADGPDPSLHFEVRRGTDSVDPAIYLGG